MHDGLGRGLVSHVLVRAHLDDGGGQLDLRGSLLTVAHGSGQSVAAASCLRSLLGLAVDVVPVVGSVRPRNTIAASTTPILLTAGSTGGRLRSPHFSLNRLFAASQSDGGGVLRPGGPAALGKGADTADNLVAVEEVEGRAAQVVILDGPLEVGADDGGHGAELVHGVFALEVHLGDRAASVRCLP